MCISSSVQYVQLHCFSRPKSARQSRLAPARPFTHAHIPLSPLTHTFSLTQLHTLTGTDIHRHSYSYRNRQRNTHREHQLAVTQRCKTGSVPAISKDDPQRKGMEGGVEKNSLWPVWQDTHRSPAESVLCQELWSHVPSGQEWCEKAKW